MTGLSATGVMPSYYDPPCGISPFPNVVAALNVYTSLYVVQIPRRVGFGPFIPARFCLYCRREQAPSSRLHVTHQGQDHRPLQLAQRARRGLPLSQHLLYGRYDGQLPLPHFHGRGGRTFRLRWRQHLKRPTARACADYTQRGGRVERLSAAERRKLDRAVKRKHRVLRSRYPEIRGASGLIG